MGRLYSPETSHLSAPKTQYSWTYWRWNHSRHSFILEDQPPQKLRLNIEVYRKTETTLTHSHTYNPQIFIVFPLTRKPSGEHVCWIDQISSKSYGVIGQECVKFNLCWKTMRAVAFCSLLSHTLDFSWSFANTCSRNWLRFLTIGIIY